MQGKRNSIRVLFQQDGQYRLILLCLLAGICAGLSAVFYRFALSWAENLRVYLFSLAKAPLQISALFLGLLLIGAVVGRITQSEPLIKGSGIPQVEGQLQGHFSPKWLPVLLKKFVAGALCLVGGLSLGREGPSIQLGAMTALGLSEKLKCSNVEEKYIVTCGASAGLAAAFNAPLAGVMFALEEIHKNFFSLALFTAMAAAIIGDIISKLFFGITSTLDLGSVRLLAFQYYPTLLIVGVLLGVFGAFYNKFLFSLQKLYGKIKLPLWGKIMIPFAFAGVIGLFFPEILGGGHNIIHDLSAGEYALNMMVLLLVGKFLFSMICFCSGAPGGIFFPLLVLGSLAGGILGELAVLLFGMPREFVMNFILLGMAGMFSGIVRAPLTGIILVVEMSGSITQLAGLTIVAYTASLTANLLGSKPVYEQLLENMTASTEMKIDHTNSVVVDYAVPFESPLAGSRISEITWPKECLVVSLARGHELIVPKGDTVMRPGDILSLVCPKGAEPDFSRFRRRDNVILDHAVSPDSALVGQRISDIQWPARCLAISISRGYDFIIPRGDTRIEAGDVISFVCPRSTEGELQAMLDDMEK